MDVLLSTINSPPGIRGAPHLIHALANNLKARGHDGTMPTGFPHYNIKEASERYRRGLWLKENLDGICVRRIRIPSFPRTSKIARGLEHFIVGLWLGGLTSLAPRADVAIIFSPSFGGSGIPAPSVPGNVQPFGAKVEVEGERHPFMRRG